MATIGVPISAGGAALRFRQVYYQTRSEPPYLAPVVLALATLAWQPALSAPLPSVKVAPSGFSSVPFNTVQPLANSVTQLAWQQQPPKAVAVAKALPGLSSVPFNTVQTNSAFQFTRLGWYQALSTPPPVAKAQIGFGSVPFDKAQLSVNFTDFSWFAPLAGAPQPASAQAGFSSVPLNTAQVAINFAPFGWHQQLSVAVAVTKAQAGNSFVPFDTAQAAAAGIAGMAWHTPLGTVPYRIAYGPQEFGYDAPRYGEIAPSPVDSTTRGSETVLTDRRGVGAPGFTPRQYDEFLAAKRAALAKVKRLKKKPAAEELREAVAIASRAAGLLGDFSPSLEPVTEALRAAATADAAHAMQAAVDAVNAAQLLLEQMDEDEDDVMLLLSI